MSGQNTDSDTPAPLLPRQIGPYRILGLLGQGASGRVYRAEEENPRREVALKVLRTASLSADAEARFRREAALLARLEHPDIARLYRAGVAETDTGPVPYLAMELIEGDELLAFARRRGLGVADKLALLAEIGRAVDYAHGRGVVHRDLKPGNILVDAAGRPHILDFGVGHHLFGEADGALTVDGQILGTLPYMSGEQLAGGNGAAGPRTDVYALGVIAYELLCGSLPFPGLSTSTVMEAIAVLRKGRAEPLARRLPEARGDTDTVVMKAMASEAAQRYASAADFAADLDRIRAREPISARPPTARYLVGLFVRRHRALSAAAAVVFIALLAASIVSTRYALSEARARNVAEGRAAELGAVNDLLTNMVKSADPTASRGRQITFAETVDVARKELEDGTALSPGVRARIAATLAGLYAQLGEPETGVAIAKAAFDKVGNALAADDPARLNLALTLANGLDDLGKLDDAHAALEPLLAITRTTGERERMRIEARIIQASLLNQTGKSEEGLPVIEAAAKEASEALGADDPKALAAESYRERLLLGAGRNEASLAVGKALIAREEAALGADNWLTLQTRSNYGYDLYASRKLPEAEQVMREVITARQRVVGPEYYVTLVDEYQLALVLEAEHRSLEAEPLVAHAVAGLEKTLGGKATDVLNCKLLQATVARSLGKRDQAETLFRQLIAAHEGLTSDTPWEKLAPANRLGELMIEEGRHAEAEAVLKTALDQARTTLGDGTHYYARLESNHGRALNGLRRYSDARPELEHALSILLPKLGAANAVTQLLYKALGECYGALGMNAEAVAARSQLAPDKAP